MIGAIAGDMIGSPFECRPIKTMDIAMRVSGFTDDTVLTLAVADAILTGRDFGDQIKAFAGRYPHAGYGGGFRKWMRSRENKPSKALAMARPCACLRSDLLLTPSTRCSRRPGVRPK